MSNEAKGREQILLYQSKQHGFPTFSIGTGDMMGRAGHRRDSGRHYSKQILTYRMYKFRR